ncbi:hypothetical protein [Actinomadura sp. NPDC048394]|uniref:hypothetical protein n=1 Tax=Actinomadura sp. NPDC048394 TaxID=3158223 RepID=UPI0033E35BEC
MGQQAYKSSARKSWRIRIPDRPKSVVLASIFLFAIGVGLCVEPIEFRSAWAAKRGHGTPGVFAAEEYIKEPKGGSHWSGPFTSENGRVQRADIFFGGKVDHVGERVRVVYTGGDYVYPPRGGWDWLWDASLFVFALVGLVVWIFVYPVRALRRRRVRLVRGSQPA